MTWKIFKKLKYQDVSFLRTLAQSKTLSCIIFQMLVTVVMDISPMSGLFLMNKWIMLSSWVRPKTDEEFSGLICRWCLATLRMSLNNLMFLSLITSEKYETPQIQNSGSTSKLLKIPQTMLQEVSRWQASLTQNDLLDLHFLNGKGKLSPTTFFQSFSLVTQR